MGQDFNTFHDFASSNLEEIYDPDDLASSLHLTANSLESGVYINNGDGTFTWRYLPREVQASPGYGLVPIDLDADGYLDLAITQNFFSSQPETGLWRGGMGLVLRGGPDGGLTPMTTLQSGMLVFGDGKGLAVLDADHDGTPDLLASQNNDRPVLMTDAGIHERRYLRVHLRGAAGNPDGIGAVVTATYADGHALTHNQSASTGYLSQSSATIFLGNPEGNAVRSLRVVWPDGTSSELDLEASQSEVEVAQSP